MFRALVMLVCMIAIPLAALFGSSLPDAIKALREGHWPKLTAGAGQASTPPEDAARLEEPAKFQPDPGAVAIHPGPLPPSQAPATEPARTPLPPGPSNRVAAWPGETAQQPAPGVVSARFETTADPNVQPARLSPAPSQPAETDRFTQIQNRLRQLGATYFLLESMGGPQPTYRFHCRMAVGGNPNITRPFEATEAEPLRAMSRVLQQVEAWGSGPR